MSHTLQISEKFSKYWLPVMAGSFLGSLFFFGAFLYISDPLVESYLRLGAFAFFVIGFLTAFKLKDGQINILYEVEENSSNLEITYSVRDRTTHRESIDMDDIIAVEIGQMPNRSLYNDFYKADRSVKLQKKNMDGWIYLNELHGRAIPLSQENAGKIVQFISEHSINVQNVN